MLFDPPSLALGVLTMFAAAQRDGQIMPLALQSVFVHACVHSERTVKALPSSNTVQVEVLVLKQPIISTQIQCPAKVFIPLKFLYNYKCQLIFLRIV